MKGYHGKFLEVNLNNLKTQEIPLSEDDLKNFIGGSALAAKLIYNHIEDGIDPLGPNNPLVFSTGPFTGTSIPMVSRYTVSGISPLTGYWGEASSGGIFPFLLKGCGYDGIFIIGKADRPIYLYINNGVAEIKNASHLWGKNCYETQKLIKDELEQKVISVASIGLAGERKIRYAGIINDNGRAAGRCGFGALMGSKNLKAVAVAGNLKAALADGEKVKVLAKEMATVIDGNFLSLAYREYGTLLYMDMGMTLGDVPAKYYQKNVFPVQKLTGHALRQNYIVENSACLGCPIGCGRVIKDFNNDFKIIDGPEYETVGAFGSLCMNFDFDSIITANHLCNLHGLDTISTGVSIAYAMYLYDIGALSKEEANMELKWGDGETIVKLVDMIVNQEGIGNLLSQGTKAMALKLGRDVDEAAQIKGLEMPLHDGRAFHGLAISYATNPRGACHLKGDYYNVDLGGAVPEFKIMPGDRLSSIGKAENAAKFQSFRDLFDALTLCKFAPFTVTKICDILNAITGWNVDSDSLLNIGDRSINIKRAISNKLGLTREEDRLPKICLKSLNEGSTSGSVPNMDYLLREYYQYRKWDWETGKPSKEVLIELGLNNVAQDLYK
ncbi:MAG: aldehyde ferredoxin oxidoreductase family protein [Candidatus Lokiarchaeota archaeon]|nr:aldehyde ferredoxin oxidoreductase family protein [Candidatus Lokiarchaeota archaeon]